MSDEELFVILADYSNDLHNLKMRDGLLPAQAAVARIKSRAQQIALEARMDEWETIPKHDLEVDGSNDTTRIITESTWNKRLAALKRSR